MHRATVWQHSSNWNIKIVHNSIEHFLWNPSDFISDYVLSCLWIVFANSAFQTPLQKIVKRVEILEMQWLSVIGLTRNGSVRWEIIPEVFKCSVQEMRGHLKDRFYENNLQAREGHHQKRNQMDSTRNSQ